MSTAPRILLVEDEQNVALTLVERLGREGFSVSHAVSCADAMQLIERSAFDLALLDVGLPDGSGFDIACSLRAIHPACAVVFLTAFADPEDRVRGLELGAEDYIVKPFHLRELILRLNKALKRVAALTDGSQKDELKLGKARLRLARFEVESDGTVHKLTHKECAVLKFFLDKRGQVVSRDEILNHVWADDEFPTPRTVDNFIVKLRKLIEPDPNAPELILSIRGVGYQMSDVKGSD